MKRQRVEIYLSSDKNDSLSDESSINLLKDSVSEYLKNSNINFTISNQAGGYLCENGSYVLENSLKITICGNFEDEFLNDFIEHFKKLYNQESVLICKQNVDERYF